jgi:pyruvate carboxylase subunit A
MNKILIANRGEIAIRVMRACKELDIPSVAVYSAADKDALFAKYADEAFEIGPAPAIKSYLDIDKIIKFAKLSGADAIHPGYGFLAENAEFAEACENEGIKFIGPSSRVITLMGNKIAARREMEKSGVPVVPGTDRSTADDQAVCQAASDIGYPVIVKPAAGGGGIGMTIVHGEDGLLRALSDSRAIAGATFGSAEVYIEKYVSNPRHIEVQILGDRHGNVIHLNERECSIQRRYQKLIEEAPSPVITPELRMEMGKAAVDAARGLNYEGAGTIEFIFSNGQFYFMEMNTRVQVEHPVTEMITGVDIVKEQIRIAAGELLSISQDDVKINGWAIECRVNAEDPQDGFAPAPGKVLAYNRPGGSGIRVDSGVYAGYTIPPFYDSMISKLVAWGKDRDEAVLRMRRALYEYAITGVCTNIPFHMAVMENARFLSGNLDTHFIEQETSLLEEVKRIIADRPTLEEKLPKASGNAKKVAAISAVAAIAQHHYRLEAS